MRPRFGSRLAQSLIQHASGHRGPLRRTSQTRKDPGFPTLSRTVEALFAHNFEDIVVTDSCTRSSRSSGENHLGRSQPEGFGIYAALGASSLSYKRTGPALTGCRQFFSRARPWRRSCRSPGGPWPSCTPASANTPKRLGSNPVMLISESPCSIHWARYLPQPAPWAMPNDDPQQSQKLRSPATGPSNGSPSGRVGDGAVEDAPDARRLEDGHALHGAAQPGHQALEVVGEQFTVGLPGRQSVRLPCFDDARRPRRCQSGRISAPGRR